REGSRPGEAVPCALRWGWRAAPSRWGAHPSTTTDGMPVGARRLGLVITHIFYVLVSVNLTCNYFALRALLGRVRCGSSPTNERTVSNALLAPAQWAQSEFALAELGDQRRTKRLVNIGAALAHSPGGRLPQAFPEWKDLKGA